MKPRLVLGERCVCCGLHLCDPDDTPPCGHPHCTICVGRGHDEDCIACEQAAEAKETGDGTRRPGE